MSAVNAFGPEFRVNHDTDGDQDQNDVIALANGKFQVVWTDHNAGTIDGQVYNANGTPVYSGDISYTDTRDDPGANSPVIAQLTDGRIALAWLDGSEAVAQVFLANQAPQTSDYGQGYSFSIDDGNSGDSDLAIAATSDGGFRVDFTRPVTDGRNVYGHSYTAHEPYNYADPGAAIVYGSNGGGYYADHASVIGLANGDYVDGFSINDVGANGIGLDISIPDLHEVKKISIGDNSRPEYANPSVAALSNGTFAVAYNVGTDVDVDVYNTSGNHIGSTNSLSANGTAPSIAAVGSGFVVAYAAPPSEYTVDNNGSAIYVAVFDAQGQYQDGSESQGRPVNTVTAGNQTNPHVVGLVDGRFVVTWDDPGLDPSQTDSSGHSVRAQILDYRTAAVALAGTALDDDYVGTAFNDMMTGQAGNDNLAGGAGNDTLGGGDNNDVLNGGVGVDSLFGNNGNDTFVVDNSGDLVFEQGGQGTDTVFAAVSYKLLSGQSVEALATASVSGTASVGLTGNDIAQQLTGNAGANTLNGGGGGDTMQGLGGNDTYIIDNAGDRVLEAVGGGTDTAFASVSYVLTAGQAVETLATASVAGTVAEHLTGNEFAQHLNGNAGANQLNGAGGADTMTGFGGNDGYIVDNAADRVVEAANGGADTVFAFVSYALQSGQSVEWLATSAVSGTAAINLTGNELAQTLNGNNGVNGLVGGGGADTLHGQGGNDRLIGGSGRDVLDGGVGNDTMVYFAVSESTGVTRDLVLTMDLSGRDRFQFTVKPTAIDIAVTHGGLNTVHFDQNLAAAVGAGQLAAHHAVLFDPDAGDLNVAGHVFLIVDANGVAGYQAGADYVVELTGVTGSLGVDDFI